jgi:DeoR/GlpR family transcriptional regulator of sugar metabolism
MPARNPQTGSQVLRDRRHRSLIDLLSEEETARAEDLATRLGVSVATVRRDLQYLESTGRINRVFGGAKATADTAWAPRAQSHVPEKRRIAAEAAKLAAHGETIALETGTTVLATANALTATGLTLVTNSVDVLIATQNRHDLKVVLSGGAFDPVIRALHGPLVERFYADHKVDRLFLGAGSLSADGVRDSYLESVSSKQAAIAAASTTVVVADSSKFAHAALAEVTGWSAVSTLVTDDGAPGALLDAIREQGVEVITA